MKLKKINEKLREGLVKRITEANTLQKETFLLKKRRTVWLSRQKEVGIHNYCYQCDPAISLWGRTIAFRAFIVEDAKVLEMEAIFEKLKGILIFILTNRLKCLLADDARLDFKNCDMKRSWCGQTVQKRNVLSSRNVLLVE
jgi:hypothetical protein